MRDSASRSPRRTARRNRHLAALAIPSAVAVGLAVVPVAPMASAQGLSSGLGAGNGSGFSDSVAPGQPTPRSPYETTYPEVEGLPAGVSVDRVEWITNRRVRVFINSAVMPGKPVQVDILLARDWHTSQDKKFPELWALDGLRARDDENGWTIETNIEQQYADKNVNVILPVGGESSFYSDWQQPDNGKHYMWESFLTKELVPVLDNGFRSNKKRAVVGLSMGGTSAINLAERHPYLFSFVGSFSGYLDTSSRGMPEAIGAAMKDAGGYNSNSMWGPNYSQDWIDHDPKLGIGALKDMTVYVSSGNGADSFGKPNSPAKGPANAAGVGLEVLSRMTTQTFVDRAKLENVEVESHFRPSGVHSWEYWQFELNEAFPSIAEALQLAPEDRVGKCAPIGAIATEAAATPNIGSCVNNEYDHSRGKAEDFRNGTVYWSAETGAHALFGAINAKYASLDGANGWLGFPKTGERTTPDGKGRYVHFEFGSIYWTPETGANAIPGDMFTAWGEKGWENSDIKYPVAEATPINGGLVQEFQNGWLTRNPDGKTHFIVHGAIGAKYGEMDTANSVLGYPTSEEIKINGGAFQAFEHGNIYWSPRTGAHFVLYGGIFDEWGKTKWEQGELGWPTTDTEEIAAGGNKQSFEHGTLTETFGMVRRGN